MQYRRHTQSDVPAIVQLFTSVFADAEGDAEGELIGRLAKDLFEQTDQRDLFNFVAASQGEIVGSIFFTRLTFQASGPVFLLAPVAVRTDKQGQGVGQALIRHGLQAVREQGVVAALTYGDPRFYTKVGFRGISEQTIAAPYELSQPEGWLGQSLAGTSLETLAGKCACVEAFREPDYW
ncbi:MAG: GNAT family N-acetyltransferase [Planctomycetaceae bacterium]|nr:GNAT family N-acetyltransferase [Planctomycetaceae bacterium]